MSVPTAGRGLFGKWDVEVGGFAVDVIGLRVVRKDSAMQVAIL